jgi:colanic acid biosynthesis glycosyl transferase WcaI
VADPWPDFPIAMGALSQPLLQVLARGVESAAYRGASLITTVTPGLVELLEKNPSAAGKVRLLPNGVDVSRFNWPVDVAKVRTSLGWSEDRFVVVYLGSVGRAQGVGTLLDALELLPDLNVEVHVIGEGFERDELEQSARQRGISRVIFHVGVPARDVPQTLAAADAALVMLRRGAMYDHSLPTKLVEGLAAGKPLIVSAGGDAARIVADAGAGFTAEPEDPVALRDAFAACIAAPDLSVRGAAGRQLAEASFDRRTIIGELARFLDEAASDGASR